MPKTTAHPVEPTEPSVQRRLRILDPDLPFLAAKAAIELDVLSRGDECPLEALKTLGDRLNNSVNVQSGGGLRSLMDPPTLSVLGRALTQSSRGHGPKSLDELAKEARESAHKLLQLHGKQDKPSDVDWAKAFCVALSTGAAAYRESVQDSRPSHPFRR